MSERLGDGTILKLFNFFDSQHFWERMIVVRVRGVRDVAVLRGDNEPFTDFRRWFQFQGGRRICKAIWQTELYSSKMTKDYIRFLDNQ